MVVTRRSQQEQLGRRMPALGGAADEQPADRLGPRGATRLAGGEDGMVGRAETRRQRRELRRLAGSLPALEADEPPDRQDGAPQIR
jgi:hypothetical protein